MFSQKYDKLSEAWLHLLKIRSVTLVLPAIHDLEQPFLQPLILWKMNSIKSCRTSPEQHSDCRIT